MTKTREELVFKAKLAEKAGRNDEMVAIMEKLVAALPEAQELTVDERILLSTAYKNAISSRKASWRITSIREQNAVRCGDGDRVTAIRHCRAKLESELSSICEGILRLLDTRLVPSATTDDSKVFFLTMKGDYHRYLAEFKTGAPRKDAARSALSAYKAAQDLAAEKLAPENTLRLGLALTISKFHFAILESPSMACTLAEKTFDQAKAALEAAGEEPFEDSTLLMQLLCVNLGLWNSGMKDDGAD